MMQKENNLAAKVRNFVKGEVKDEEDALLSRKVTKREYEKVIDYALELGMEDGFIQEGEAAKESFIPEFNLEGIGI